MSFEGYYQYWCKNGHYNECDVYLMFYDGKFMCHTCGEEAVFRNLVDLTNGSFEYDEEGNEIRIDNYIEPELLVEAPICTCDACGHTHPTGPAIYKIPSEE